MAQFVLGTDITEVGLVDKLVNELQVAACVQLVLKPALNSDVQRFTVARMAAATVRPVTRPQAFAASSLLQQQISLIVEQKDRKGTMKYAVAIMAFGFVQSTGLPVVGVYQD